MRTDGRTDMTKLIVVYCNLEKRLKSIVSGNKEREGKFYVLLTLHLGSILVNNKLDSQFFFHIYLFQFSTCFEHHCAHHQENQLH